MSRLFHYQSVPYQKIWDHIGGPTTRASFRPAGMSTVDWANQQVDLYAKNELCNESNWVGVVSSVKMGGFRNPHKSKCTC